MTASWSPQVARFCRQYFQLEPALDFPQGAFLKLQDAQYAIYKAMFSDAQGLHLPPQRYRLRVLKDLVGRIEASIDDWDKYATSDDLMNALAELLATPLPSETVSAQQKCYVTYLLSFLASSNAENDTKPTDEPHTTLLENRALIAASGTTGLRTWEAALHLGQFLCQNPALVKGRRVLELGAGTGYISILCANHLGAEHVIASDGSDDVINNLPENLYLNGLQNEAEDSRTVTPMDLKWGHALVGTEEAHWNGGRPVDIVVGADVTYDRSVIPALVGTLLELLELYPRVETYIAATQRNEATFGTFLESCRLQGLKVDDVSFDVPRRDRQMGPFYNDQVAIRICRVFRS